MAGRIRIGVGGWTFEPWRGVFYPKDVKQKDELAYASRHLTAIEINGTYYSTFKPDSWKKWRDETPEGFVFAVKGSRFTTNRRELAGAGESLERYFAQGVAELGDRLGPFLWQLPHTKKFDAADLEGFFSLLPKELDGHPAAPRAGAAPRQLLHAGLPGAAAQARHRQRLRQARDAIRRSPTSRPTSSTPGCRPATTRWRPPITPAELDGWAARLKTWAGGGAPDGLPIVDAAHAAPKTPRDVFAFIIHEGKIRAPAGAMALIERCK